MQRRAEADADLVDHLALVALGVGGPRGGVREHAGTMSVTQRVEGRCVPVHRLGVRLASLAVTHVSGTQAAPLLRHGGPVSRHAADVADAPRLVCPVRSRVAAGWRRANRRRAPDGVTQVAEGAVGADASLEQLRETAAFAPLQLRYVYRGAGGGVRVRHAPMHLQPLLELGAREGPLEGAGDGGVLRLDGALHSAVPPAVRGGGLEEPEVGLGADAAGHAGHLTPASEGCGGD